MIFNRMVGKYKKSGQFVWWLSSYVIILVLAIAINTIGYFVTINVMEHEIEKNNQYTLEKIGFICDNQFNEIIGSAYNILRMSSVKQMNRDNIGSYERYLFSSQVLNDISNELINNSKIEDCAVIFKGQDICIHSGVGKTSIDMIYSSYYKRWYESYEEWVGQVFSVSGYEFMIKDDKNLLKDYFIVYRIPNVNKDVAVILKINIEQLVKPFAEGSSENEKYFLIDDDGNIVYSEDRDINLKKIDFGDNSSKSVRINGREYLAGYQSLSTVSLKYVRFIPADVYLRSIKNVRLAFILGYILTVIFVGAVALWFAVINERKKRILDEEMEKQKKYIRQDILKQMLTGRKKIRTDEFLGNIPFLKYKSFAVVIFDFMTSGERENEDADIDYRLLNTYISGSFEKSLLYKPDFCIINDVCAGVLEIKNPADISAVLSTAEEICNSLSKSMSLETRCSVSSICDNTENLHECYEQAMDITNQRLLGDQKIVFMYEDIIYDYPDYNYISSKGEAIAALLSVGEYERVKKLTESMFDGSGYKVTFSMQRIFILELIGVVLRVAVQIDIDKTIDFRELYQSSMNINSKNQLVYAKKLILQNMQMICESVNRRKTPVSSLKYKDIVQYIDEHYMDPTLNVNTLAELFHINRSWLSRNFQKEMGVSLSEYIVKYRIEKAKELLKTEKTVSQIAEEVGFTSESIYYRAFKKCENITSSQYRMMLNIKNRDRD